MSVIPEVLDALVAAWGAAAQTGNLAGLRRDQVYDGPPVTQAGTEGVAVGASVEDNAVEFTAPPSAMDGTTQDQFTITCLAWSGSGDTTFKPRRDQVDAVLDALELALSADRTLGGVVSTAWITSGNWTQTQASGALVTCEFRVDFTRF